MLPPLELPQTFQDVALLVPGGNRLLRDAADVTGGGGTQAQPLLPGQGGLKGDDKDKDNVSFWGGQLSNNEW